jgi:O-antigen/teichoic acid export membrane protein
VEVNVRSIVSHGGRLRSHLRVPLYRNAYTLMVSGVGTAVFGLLFWAVASRSFPPTIVGTSTAAIAALTFLTGLAGLYLDGALYRFLPRSGDATRRLVGWSTFVTVLAAIGASGVFLLGLDLWAPALSFAVSSPWIVLVCIGATIVSCILLLQDGILIGLRATGWVPVKNIGYSIAKVIALVALAGVASTYGILLAWVVPAVVVAIPAGYLISKRLVPQHCNATRPRQEYARAREIVAYTAGNYAGFLCMLAYRNLPPLLVIHQAGPRASAFFYPPWLIAMSLTVLISNVSTSLVVEGSVDRQQLTTHTRRAVRQTARLILPITAVLFFGAPYVLRMFGGEYADEGDVLLRILAVSLIPSSVCVLSFGVARVQDHIGAIIVNQALLAGLVLGVGALLLSPLGIEGVGASWLLAQTAVGVVLGWTQLRPALRGRLGTVQAVASYDTIAGSRGGDA